MKGDDSEFQSKSQKSERLRFIIWQVELVVPPQCKTRPMFLPSGGCYVVEKSAAGNP